MSHRGLQQALVIAHHDPGFVDAMHADPDAALGPLGLTAAERAQLLAVDRRAFATDPLRARRVLKVLAEELKIATTLALWETRSAGTAEGFFASPFFRAAVAERSALTPAYGAYLAAAPLVTPQLPDVIRFETMLARCRRDVAPRPRLGLAPGVACGAFDAGLLETIQRVEKFLFELALVPQLGFCAGGPTLPELPPPGPAKIYLAVTPAGLTTIDADLHRVLAAFADPEPRQALLRAGVRPAQLDALIESLAGDGLVTSASPPA